MALVLRGFRVIEAPSGRKKLLTIKVFKKWTNQEVEEVFDHNIFDSEAWRKFLTTFKNDDGKLLPRYTEDGEQVGYQVYFWGAPRWAKEAYGKGGKHGVFIPLFPLDKKGEKLDIAEYGTLKKL